MEVLGLLEQHTCMSQPHTCLTIAHADSTLLPPSQGVNPGVEILECEYAKVDVEKILDARAFEFGKTLTAELEVSCRAVPVSCREASGW